MMRVILLSGYRSSIDGSLLDHRIKKLREMGFGVITVLAGEQAESHLRISRHLETTELVFDTHGDEATLASNLRAGIKVLQGRGAFIMPLELELPPTEVWRALTAESRRQGLGEAHVLQAVDATGALCHSGFPFYLTAKGVGFLTHLQNFTRLSDARLNYHYVLSHLESDLAPIEKPP